MDLLSYKKPGAILFDKMVEIAKRPLPDSRIGNKEWEKIVYDKYGFIKSITSNIESDAGRKRSYSYRKAHHLLTPYEVRQLKQAISITDARFEGSENRGWSPDILTGI